MHEHVSASTAVHRAGRPRRATDADTWSRPAVPRYRAALAADRAEVRACQRLRAEVFRRGWRARLPFRRAAGGLARRRVRTSSATTCSSATRPPVAVVATCRLLSPERAAALGRGHGDDGFDRTGHAAFRPDLVEAGRACLHPGHGGGAVVARPVVRGGRHRAGGVATGSWAGGCPSRWPTAGRRRRARGTPSAHGISRRPPLRVVPRVPYDVDAAARPARLVMPSLLRASLRIGAHVCGPPAHDAGLGTADLYVLLRMVDVPPRLRRPAVSA